MRRLLLIWCLVGSLQAEIVDRLAIAVGQDVITELQIDEEIRVTAFLNQQPVTRTLDTRRAAADRLIAQLLVKREMQLSHYPLPEADEENSYFQKIQSGFGSRSSYERALTTYDLTESNLREHLALQLTTLRFIEYRFRPDVGISDADVENYYERELASWAYSRPSLAPPQPAQEKERIRKTLIEERTDEALDTWLRESRKQVEIVYIDKSLQ